MIFDSAASVPLKYSSVSREYTQFEDMNRTYEKHFERVVFFHIWCLHSVYFFTNMFYRSETVTLVIQVLEYCTLVFGFLYIC